MFGNQNNGVGPRDRYYEWLLEARDNGTAWDGTVRPAPAAATCANQSYAFTIPDGQGLHHPGFSHIRRAYEAAVTRRLLFCFFQHLSLCLSLTHTPSLTARWKKKTRFFVSTSTRAKSLSLSLTHTHTSGQIIDKKWV